MIKDLCKKENVSISEFARRLGQTPQNFGKKLNRDTITLDEMMEIAKVLDVSYEQAFVCRDGGRM